MPARRLTAVNCRDSLLDVLDRGGSLEFAIDHGPAEPAPPTTNGDASAATAAHGTTPHIAESGRPRKEHLAETPHAAAPHLMWRVRLRGVSKDTITVDHLAAHGRVIGVSPGVPLKGSLTIGQNRWTFNTEVVAAKPDGLTLRFPQNFNRVPRRSSRRFSTSGVILPPLRAWPLSDPLTAVPAEIACAKRLQEAACPAGPIPHPAADHDHTKELFWPESGPGAAATLTNIGGGGFGAVSPQDESRGLRPGHLHFVRLDLRPLLATPVDLTARLAYTHAASDGSVRAGFAFEFGLHPAHRDVVLSALAGAMHDLTQRIARPAA